MYYWNQVTNETAWTLPDDAQRGEEVKTEAYSKYRNFSSNAKVTAYNYYNPTSQTKINSNYPPNATRNVKKVAAPAFAPNELSTRLGSRT